MGLYGGLPRFRGRVIVLACLAACLAVSPAAASASAASLKVTPDAATFYYDSYTPIKAVVSGTDDANSSLNVFLQPAGGGCAATADSESSNPYAVLSNYSAPGYYHDSNGSPPAGSFSLPVGFELSPEQLGSYLICAYLDPGDPQSGGPSVTASAPLSLLHSTTAFTNYLPSQALLTDPERINSMHAPYVAFAGAVQPVRFGLTVTLSAASARALHIKVRRLQSTVVDLTSSGCSHDEHLGNRVLGVTYCPMHPRAVSRADAAAITKTLDRGRKITLTYDYAVSFSTGQTVQNVQTVKLGPDGSPPLRDENVYASTLVLYGQFPFDYGRGGSATGG